MIPENRLSTTAVLSGWLNPPAVRAIYSQHWGPVAIQDPAEGMLYQLWEARIAFNAITVQAPNTVATTLFTRVNEIKQVSLAFDQSGFPVVAFVESTGAAFLRWFDTTVPGYVITPLASGVLTPRVTLDDARQFAGAISDVILAYVRAGNLYYRQQRDRYTIERLLKAGVEELKHVSMNNGLRLQFKYKGPGFPFAPFLADVVSGLCRRAGIPEENINVDELYNQTVEGFAVSQDDGINKRIDKLREIFMFDKSEHDKKIYFPRRGRQVVTRIPYSGHLGLVADEPSALKPTIVDELSLPRLVEINHLDPAGGFATNKQQAFRRTNTIKTQKKLTIEAEVVLTADQAATAALINLKANWLEPINFSFVTTIAYSFLVETDVIEVEDKNGDWHRIRITEKNDNKNTIEFSGKADAGQDAYASLGIGQSLPPPISTTPGLVGATDLEILNIPCLRDQDDELGVYIAVAGASSAWYGASILISTDGGANYFEALEIQTPATIGETLTALADERDEGYPSNQSVEVLVNFTLESVTYDNLLTNLNRAVLGDEVVQFQFAVLQGMVGSKYRYKLSGLVRGRYATDVEAWPIGTRFVLLDSSVTFMQAQQWMLGKEIDIKPVTSGQTEDETIATAYDYNEGVSQREFPVEHVTATRDGSNNVTVSFVGRGRLGIETAPRNGKYFAGYRVKFSDGFSFDTQVMQYVRNATPVGATVQVCALNTVTGEGIYSGAIAT